MITEAIFNLSQRFNQACEYMKEHDCENCPFKYGDWDSMKCPEFNFTSLQQVEKMFEMLAVSDKSCVVVDIETLRQSKPPLSVA